MPQIYLKGCYTILGKITSSQKEKFECSIPLENKPDVVVEIMPDKKIAEAIHKVTISEGLWDILQQNKISDATKLPLELQKEISNIMPHINKATQKVLYFIKYWLRCGDLQEKLCSIKGFYWSVDKSEWKRFPFLIDVMMYTDFILTLDEYNCDVIQKYIQDGIEPFLTFRHLHRAKIELIPRYKWIDATIAAELAIKEFLIRFKPELESLLLSVPSPPLHKLYGEVLESYANKRSPKLSEISKGVERRNRLLHKPQEEHISDEEAIKYVSDIEVAIYHLLTLLYPEDPFIKKTWTRIKN